MRKWLLAFVAAALGGGLWYSFRRLEWLGEARSQIALGLSMIGASIADVWAWLPGNLGTLTGLSGLALTWATFVRVAMDIRRAQREDKTGR